MKITRVWVVVKPTEHSTLEDICFQVELAELYKQYQGGLKPEDVYSFYDGKAAAETVAKHLLFKNGNLKA